LVIDDIITRVDLAMGLARIIIPSPSARSRKHRLDAQQVFHLPGFEDPALRIHEGDARRIDVIEFLKITRMIGVNPTDILNLSHDQLQVARH